MQFSIILPYFERPEVLLVTLRSFQALYAEESVEIIIVDDGSRDHLKPRIPSTLTLPIKILSIHNKDGINPCTPINIGVSAASGDFIILSSPEVVHTESVVNYLLESEIGADEAWFFNVFALTSIEVNSMMNQVKSNDELIEIYETFEKKFTQELGLNGYGWANSLGSWYCHPVYRRTDLNFLSAMRRDSFISVGGFNERYRKGSGFDDNEFRRRLLSCGFSFVYKGNRAAIHLIHEEVATRSDIKMGINSNERIYRSLFFRLLPRKSIRKNYAYDIEEINYN